MASAAEKSQAGEEDEGWLRSSLISASSWISSLGDTTGLSTLLPWLQAFEDEEALADEDNGKRNSRNRRRSNDPSEEPAAFKSNSTSNKSRASRRGIRSWLPSRRSKNTSEQSRRSTVTSTQSRSDARSSHNSVTSRGLRESVVGEPRRYTNSTTLRTPRSSVTYYSSMNSQPRYSMYSIPGSSGGEHIRAPTWYRAKVPDRMTKVRRNGGRSKKFKERHCAIM